MKYETFKQLSDFSLQNMLQLNYLPDSCNRDFKIILATHMGVEVIVANSELKDLYKDLLIKRDSMFPSEARLSEGVCDRNDVFQCLSEWDKFKQEKQEAAEKLRLMHGRLEKLAEDMLKNKRFFEDCNAKQE